MTKKEEEELKAKFEDEFEGRICDRHTIYSNISDFDDCEYYFEDEETEDKETED